MPPEFLERDAVLFLHDRALQEYGGIQGIRDEGLLDSALSRPLNKLNYAEADAPDLAALAASYAFGLAKNHAFNDGNKRTAWGSCVLFLKANGIGLLIDAADVITHMLELAQNRTDEAAFAAWLRLHQSPGA